MQHFILMRFKVKEYTNFRLEFDPHIEFRKNMGEKYCHIFSDTDNLNKVTVLFEWKSLEAAKDFISDPYLSEILQIAGVLDQPRVHLLIKE